MKQRTWLTFAALIVTTLALAWMPAPVRPQEKEKGLFGLTKVWKFHLELTAKDYDKMQPSGGPGGFSPKKVDGKQAERPTDVHKGSGFGLEFPWVHADLSAEGKTYKDIGLRYKGNASYGTTSRGLKRNFRIDLDHYDDKLRFHGLKSIMLNAGGLDPGRCGSFA